MMVARRSHAESLDSHLYLDDVPLAGGVVVCALPVPAHATEESMIPHKPVRRLEPDETGGAAFSVPTAHQFRHTSRWEPHRSRGVDSPKQGHDAIPSGSVRRRSGSPDPLASRVAVQEALRRLSTRIDLSKS